MRKGTKPRPMEHAFQCKWQENQGDSLFLETLISILNDMYRKKESNKKKFFRTGTIIITLSALVSFFNTVSLTLTFASVTPWIGVSVSFLVSLLSAIVTILIALKNSKKYKETWLRHQQSYARIYQEMYNYTFSLDIYLNTKNANERNLLFKAQIGRYLAEDQSRFEQNMTNIQDDDYS
ncbi:MAG: DUF4231 domain-containing protein [Lachnospiraceae bacterium]|jgi:hypothetical protein|nr:DUF4231 domain-containing protein [Lachnospiraceae bacterium]